MPNDDCPLCLTIDRQLTKLTLAVERFHVEAGGSSEGLREHTLAAICSWWITETMKDPTLGPDAIVRCVANCLAHEHGIPGAERLTAVRLSRTT